MSESSPNVPLSSPPATARKVFYGYAALALLCLGVGIGTGEYWLAGTPWIFARCSGYSWP